MNLLRKYEISIGYYGSDEMKVIVGPWEYAETEDEAEAMFRAAVDSLNFDKMSIDRI